MNKFECELEALDVASKHANQTASQLLARESGQQARMEERKRQRDNNHDGANLNA